MPSVAEELQELRRLSLAKEHASKLQGANGLSTPEQEAESLKDAKNKTHIKSYKQEAEESLKAGAKGAVDQDLDFKVQQGTKKKQDLEKKKEAAQNLQNFKQKSIDPVTKATVPAANADKDVDVSAGSPIEVVPNEMEGVPDLEALEAETVVDMPSSPPPETAGTIPDMSSISDPTAAMNTPRVPNRAEKKSRKIMERLGMKPVVGISRMTLQMRGNQGFFTIYQPDVFEKSGSYIVFGEARQGTGMPGKLQQQAHAAQQLASPLVEEQKADPAVEEVEEEVDETGMDAKDIELVVTQAGCSRARAVAALKTNDGDLVNAIMSLTS